MGQLQQITTNNQFFYLKTKQEPSKKIVTT